jgi:hypothetical protein
MTLWPEIWREGRRDGEKPVIRRRSPSSDLLF